MSDRSSELSPTIITGSWTTSGWSICGGCETLGRPCAWVRRSLTTWRAALRSVPGWNTQFDAETPGDGFRVDRVDERHSGEQVLLERHGDHLLDLGAERPSASVWISTVGGRNSGSESRGIVAQLHHADDEYPERGGEDDAP